jgi:hypothetical protein
MATAMTPLTFSCGGGSDGDDDESPLSPVATGSVGIDVPPGVQDEDAIRYVPAAADNFGSWVTMTVHGVEVEVPSSDQYRVQVVRDPCFGDQRMFVLIEDKVSKDRFRVDLVEPKVTTETKEPAGTQEMSARILASVRGTHETPSLIATLGPRPTLASCSGEGGGVPALIVDDFTPPPVPSVIVDEKTVSPDQEGQ